MPFLKEMIGVYQGNCNMGDLKLVQYFFNNQVGMMKSRINEKQVVSSNSGNHFISSNVVCTKKIKPMEQSICDEVLSRNVKIFMFDTGSSKNMLSLTVLQVFQALKI